MSLSVSPGEFLHFFLRLVQANQERDCPSFDRRFGGYGSLDPPQCRGRKGILLEGRQDALVGEDASATLCSIGEESPAGRLENLIDDRLGKSAEVDVELAIRTGLEDFQEVPQGSLESWIDVGVPQSPVCIALKGVQSTA